jgi:hypothetical protein
MVPANGRSYLLARNTAAAAAQGSGRVATVRCFQAKGIGVTPLAGAGANWVHSNGCASIEEGVREAIFSEIADAEFPHGAVPVVAILDTGLHFSSPTQKGINHNRMQRAIIVRPAVLRLAHAERAPSFNHSLTGYANSQLDDVQRTKEVIHQWRTQDQAAQAECLTVPTLAELARRIAEQVAFGQVHRIFNGGYFSSNLSTTGALLDFGGMRALPNWANARNFDHAVGFGDEMKIVTKVIQSLAFYFNKYQPRTASSVEERALVAESNEAYACAFATECLRIWNVNATTDTDLTAAITQSVRQYFAHQQKLQVNYKHGLVKSQGWLYDSVVAGARGTTRDSSAEVHTISAIQCALQGHFAGPLNSDKRLLQAWSTAARFLMPRDSIDRELLQKHINRLLSDRRARSRGDSRLFGDLIGKTVGASRRHWPRLPADLSVRAHVAYEGSTALHCLDLITNQSVLWLESIRWQGQFRLFDSTFTLEEGEYIGVRRDGVYWTAKIPLPLGEPGSGFVLELKDRSIQIPAMQLEYAQPGAWLTGVGSKQMNVASA